MKRRIFDGWTQRGRSKPPPVSRDAFAPGDLVSVVTSDGLFGVVKVLASESDGLHIRLYVQRFAERPGPPDLTELSTAPFGKGHDNPFSIGHLPLSYTSFSRWQPKRITRGSVVTEDELEGYHLWLEANGGYF
jgi:hypothetical protein